MFYSWWSLKISGEFDFFVRAKRLWDWAILPYIFDSRRKVYIYVIAARRNNFLQGCLQTWLVKSMWVACLCQALEKTIIAYSNVRIIKNFVWIKKSSLSYFYCVERMQDRPAVLYWFRWALMSKVYLSSSLCVLKNGTSGKRWTSHTYFCKL